MQQAGGEKDGVAVEASESARVRHGADVPEGVVGGDGGAGERVEEGGDGQQAEEEGDEGPVDDAPLEGGGARHAPVGERDAELDGEDGEVEEGLLDLSNLRW